MTEKEFRYMMDRMRLLPERLKAARKKVKHLENEAKRFGMLELVEHE
jgi:PHD/YefM family antitoxin component YafN of YafNO toxin-antitoxin module